MSEDVLNALCAKRGFTTAALRLLLRTRELIMLAMGLALGQWRESRDPVSGAFAEHCHAELRLDDQLEINAIFRGRMLRIHAAHRKRYTPEERFRVVVFVETRGLSHQHAAGIFMVDAATIGRWVREEEREPDKNTVGSLLKAVPPVRSVDDVTTRLVELLDRFRVGGSKRIVQILARAGRLIGRETVRRHRKHRRLPPPAKCAQASGRAVRAKEPNHVWMTDITNIPSLFGIWILKLVVVLDVYSRFPLSFRVFSSEPTSEALAELVEEAAMRFGPPKHMVTDRGSQFTGEQFVCKLRELGTRQRFGAIGQSGSIAIIERLWRTLKEMLDLHSVPPLSRSHLEEKVALGLFYYANIRPHQGLGGATPAEKYYRLTPAYDSAMRCQDTACIRDDPAALPFEIVHLDRERRLPVLIPTERAA